MSHGSNAELLDGVAALLEDWRAAGRTGPLAEVQPAYAAFNGLTDGWADLRDGLAAAARHDLPDRDRQLLDRLVQSADAAVRRL